MQRKITGWMIHLLILGSNLTKGRIVVGTKVGANTATFGGFKQRRQHGLTVGPHDGLRRFDHDFKFQGAVALPLVQGNSSETAHSSLD